MPETSIPVIPENANKYEILGVPATATEQELRVAYRRLALLYHPDRHPEAEREEAGKFFRQIASAYATLSNPAERRRYDLAFSRREEFREGAAGAHEVSLADILAGIDAYEHMFSEGSVAAISEKLDAIVQQSLIADLGEQIVEAWPLPAAPRGSQHKGTFSSGALVLTNVRVLLPYLYTWQETHGNVKTTYTGAGMPVLPLPLLESIEVVAAKRVKRQLSVHFQYKGGDISIRARKTNLSKLLLVAQLWGIPVESREEDAKWAELRWAVLRPWIWTVSIVVAFMAAAGAIGLFSDGILDKIADFSDFLSHWGLWQWSAVLTGAVCGGRLWKWTLAYSGVDLAQALRQTEASRQSALSPRIGAVVNSD